MLLQTINLFCVVKRSDFNWCQNDNPSYFCHYQILWKGIRFVAYGLQDSYFLIFIWTSFTKYFKIPIKTNSHFGFSSSVLTGLILACLSQPFPFTSILFFLIWRWTDEKNSLGNSSCALWDMFFIQSLGLSVAIHLVSLWSGIHLAWQIPNGEGRFSWVCCHVCSQTKAFLHGFV